MLALVVFSVLLTNIHGFALDGSEEIDAAPRIINGLPAEPGQFKYMVSLRTSRDAHSCGGSIIAKNWIVTAAHCIGPAVEAVAGTIHMSAKGGDRYKIIKQFPHPKYDPARSRNENDIGLVKLEKPIRSSKMVQRIEMGSVLGLGGSVTAIGWGTGSGQTLKYLAMKMTTDCELDQRIAICTMNPKGSTCHGDSGGPLVQGDKLVGLTSGGDDKCAFTHPKYFTRVAAFRSWIESEMKKNE